MREVAVDISKNTGSKIRLKSNDTVNMPLKRRPFPLVGKNTRLILICSDAIAPKPASAPSLCHSPMEPELAEVGSVLYRGSCACTEIKPKLSC